MDKSCSVVVPTHNRLGSLRLCLESLFRQNRMPDEIVVVDDASTDGTREYLEQLAVGKIRVLRNKTAGGSASARNLGVEIATGAVVVFIDDDCVADEEWLENLVGGLKESDGFAFGRTVYRSENYHGHFPEKIVNNSNGRWPGGANLIFDKQVFERLGGFADEFWQYRNEDTELAIRAVSRGIRYARVRGAVVYHQQSQWSVGTLLDSAKNLSVWVILQQRYPDTYWEFGAPVWGRVAAPADYIFLIFLPTLIPPALILLILLIRYWLLGGRDLKLFFAKWPVWLVLRRWWVWKEAWQRRYLMI